MHSIATQKAIATTICADELAQGDVVFYCNSCIIVLTEPQYVQQGIVFDALWLEIDSPDNTQQLCFNREKLLELISHTPISNTRLAA